MSDALLYLDPDSELNLQSQIRQKLVEAINLQTFPAGRRLPSSRKLAEQLGVARNTVVLVYQQLTDEGYLVSRERSGIFVNEKILGGYVGFEGRTTSGLASNSAWRQRIKANPIKQAGFNPPPDWQQYPYPFIDGQFDASLYPAKEWREATRQSLGLGEIRKWASEAGDADDMMLIEQIRTRILPRRGIQAGADEILITVGAQQALYISCALLVDSTVAVAVEEPGYPGIRQMLAQRGAPMSYQPVDEQGLIVDERLDECKLVYVTPSHQTPTAVTMSMERRRVLLAKAVERDLLIIEDDFEFESNFLGQPHPALRSMDGNDRVIYVSSLSKVLAPGIMLGFMVASPELIVEARKLRRLMVSHPPMNNQRSAAFFLSLGHYDTFLMHLNDKFRERWTALRQALNYYLVELAEITPAQGGSTFWIKGPEGLDVKYLAKEAARRGVLIEPVNHYYATANVADNCFRMGVTSIPTEKIRDGVQRLAELIAELTGVRSQDEIQPLPKGYLSGNELQKTLAGASLLCKTIYGDPCTIELLPDGGMLGRAGYANEDRDSGRWWIEEDVWYRQWQRWSYAEVFGYLTVVTGDQIRWYDKDTHGLVETAIIRPAQQ